MNKTVQKRRVLLILAALFTLLFISAMAIPLIIEVTYADTKESPMHILNYDTNRLFWSEGLSNVDEDGAYRLNLFDSLPTDEDGMKIIAPGDADGGSMRLVNKTARPIHYSAVIYLASNDGVPIKADFSNFDPLNRQTLFSLPDGITSDDVLRAVGGELDAYEYCDFDVAWLWEFSTDAEGDALDTEIGDKDLSLVELGVWVTVTDNLEPNVPDGSDGYLNVDTDGDSIADTNIDTDNDGEAEINVDIDGDYFPDINIDVDGDYFPDIDIDINGDCTPDCNFDNDDDNVADTNILPIEIVDGVAIITPEAAEMIFEILSESGNTTLKLDNFGQQVTSVIFPVDELSDYADAGCDIAISFTNITVMLDNEALSDVADASRASTVQITAKPTLKNDFNDAQVEAFGNDFVAAGVDFSIASGGSALKGDSIGGHIDLSVPYKLYDGTTLGDYKLYSVSGSGDLEEQEFSYVNGKFLFEAEKIGDYAFICDNPDAIPDDGGELTPEPPSCSCLICFFGGECTTCWLCWLFVILIALCAVIVLVTIILILIYGL